MRRYTRAAAASPMLRASRVFTLPGRGAFAKTSNTALSASCAAPRRSAASASRRAETSRSC